MSMFSVSNRNFEVETSQDFSVERIHKAKSIADIVRFHMSQDISVAIIIATIDMFVEDNFTTEEVTSFFINRKPEIDLLTALVMLFS